MSDKDMNKNEEQLRSAQNPLTPEGVPTPNTELPAEPVKLEAIPGDGQVGNEPPDPVQDAATLTQEPEVTALVVKSEKDENAKPQNEAWQTWLRPVVVLVCICLLASLLLSVTNAITLPRIEQNTNVVADKARQAVLTEADGFTDVTPSPLPENILSVHKANNGAGYVVEAFGKGYGGTVPAMVGYNMEGEITGVQFLENNETPGLGKNLSSSPKFANQLLDFSAKDAIQLDEIDALAGATLSTNAALSAVNAASNYFFVDVLGGSIDYQIGDEMLAVLLPDGMTWEKLDVEATGVAGAYKRSDGNYVLVGQASGESGSQPVSVMVVLDDAGTILDMVVDNSAETDGLGKNNPKVDTFIAGFKGVNDVSSIDTVAGATHTTGAIKQATQQAMDALELAKEAA